MNDTFLNSANAPYVAELYSKFRNDPESVDTTWKDFFNNLNEDDYSVLKDFGGPEWKERPSSIIDKNYITKVIKSNANYNSEEFRISTLDSIRALRLIRAFRINGHLIADLDPLGISEREYPQELDYKSYGFIESDLEKEIFIDGSLGLEKDKLKNKKKLVVVGSPEHCPHSKIESIIEKLLSGENLPQSVEYLSQADQIAKTLAKTLSIKSGDILTPIEQQVLLDDFFGCKETSVSPFNRSIFISLEKSEIEKN